MYILKKTLNNLSPNLSLWVMPVKNSIYMYIGFYKVKNISRCKTFRLASMPTFVLKTECLKSTSKTLQLLWYSKLWYLIHLQICQCKSRTFNPSMSKNLLYLFFNWFKVICKQLMPTTECPPQKLLANLVDPWIYM